MAKSTPPPQLPWFEDQARFADRVDFAKTYSLITVRVETIWKCKRPISLKEAGDNMQKHFYTCLLMFLTYESNIICSTYIIGQCTLTFKSMERIVWQKWPCHCQSKWTMKKTMNCLAIPLFFYCETSTNQSICLEFLIHQKNYFETLLINNFLRMQECLLRDRLVKLKPKNINWTPSRFLKMELKAFGLVFEVSKFIICLWKNLWSFYGVISYYLQRHCRNAVNEIPS